MISQVLRIFFYSEPNFPNADPVQPSAPPEAELYHGAVEAMDHHNEEDLPIASAVAIPIVEGEESHLPEYFVDEFPTAENAPQSQSSALLVNSDSSNSNQPPYLTGFGLNPQRARCPFCNHEGRTNVHFTVDVFTFFMMGLLFLVFWPICWLPLLMPGCKNTEHFCSNCHRKVRAPKACISIIVFTLRDCIDVPVL